MNAYRTRMVRRHRCEVCNTVYVCEACTDVAEEYLNSKTPWRINNKSNSFGNGVYTAPDCMKQFVCEPCKEKQ